MGVAQGARADGGGEHDLPADQAGREYGCVLASHEHVLCGCVVASPLTRALRSIRVRGMAWAGAWTRDIRTRSSLQQSQVLKILKTLESRQLIKSVKSVEVLRRCRPAGDACAAANALPAATARLVVARNAQSKNKRLYMLAGIEPSRQITGGAWYSEQEFDSEYINVLSQTCLAFIQSKARSRVGRDGCTVHYLPG